MSDGATALSSLLSKRGHELVNFKFLPGARRGLTAKLLHGEAARVIDSAISKGPVHNPPASGRQKTTL